MSDRDKDQTVKAEGLSAKAAAGNVRVIVLSDEVAAIDSAEFLAYLEERGAKPECPSCGRNDWAVGKRLVQNLVGFDVMLNNEAGAPDELVPTTLDLIAMICRNCGFLRSHSLAQYLRHRRRRADER